MKRKKPFFLAIAASVLSLGLASSFLKTRTEQFNRLEKPVFIVIAAKNIPKGTLLNGFYISRKQVPERFAEPSALRSEKKIEGMITAVPILKGEQMTETKLLPLGIKSGLSIRVPQGMRALSFGVDAVSGVGGLIRPNDFVDLMATFDLEGGYGKTETKTVTVVQNVQVLAVDTNIDDGPPLYDPTEEKSLFSKGSLEVPFGVREKTVTLALLPEAAQRAELAGQVGKITLALRGKQDREILEGEGARLEDLVGTQAVLKRTRFREYRGER